MNFDKPTIVVMDGGCVLQRSTALHPIQNLFVCQVPYGSELSRILSNIEYISSILSIL